MHRTHGGNRAASRPDPWFCKTICVVLWLAQDKVAETEYVHSPEQDLVVLFVSKWREGMLWRHVERRELA
jgi:hypothetical protein